MEPGGQRGFGFDRKGAAPKPEQTLSDREKFAKVGLLQSYIEGKVGRELESYFKKDVRGTAAFKQVSAKLSGEIFSKIAETKGLSPDEKREMLAAHIDEYLFENQMKPRPEPVGDVTSVQGEIAMQESAAPMEAEAPEPRTEEDYQALGEARLSRELENDKTLKEIRDELDEKLTVAAQQTNEIVMNENATAEEIDRAIREQEEIGAAVDAANRRIAESLRRQAAARKPSVNGPSRAAARPEAYQDEFDTKLDSE